MVRTTTVSGCVRDYSGSSQSGRVVAVLDKPFVSLDNHNVIPGRVVSDSDVDNVFVLNLVPNSHTTTNYIVTYDPTPNDKTPLKLKKGVLSKTVRVPDNDVSLEDLLR